MPRYHFNLSECGDDTSDEDGQELPDLSAAKTVAIHEARVLMATEIIEGRLCLGCHIDVADEHGAVQCRIAFRDVVTIEGLLRVT